MKIAETYRRRVMGTPDKSVRLTESKDSDKLIEALRQCIDAAPERNKNKLAGVFEDYQEKFGKVPGKRLPYMMQGFFDAIEDASDARVGRD
jgi:hypothetical protein